MIKKKVLVLGSEGYLGSVLIPSLLKKKNINLHGIDNCIFGFFNKFKKFYLKSQDIKNITKKDLKNVSIIIDLANISNDPASELDSKFTKINNYDYKKKIIDKLKNNDLFEKYIYISSCSVYGFNEKIVNEKDTTKPISLYSKFCKKTEDYIKKKLKKKFVTFRLGTLYGWSPRMRYDIAINKLIRDGYFLKKIEINGGDQFRFFCYNKLAVDAIIEAIDNRKLMGQIFNLGNVNFNINDLTKKIVKKINIKDLQVIKDQFNVDKRSYKVSSSKFKKITNNKFTNHDFEKTIMETYKKIKTDKKPFDKNKVTLNLYKKILKLQK